MFAAVSSRARVQQSEPSTGEHTSSPGSPRPEISARTPPACGIDFVDRAREHEPPTPEPVGRAAPAPLQRLPGARAAPRPSSAALRDARRLGTAGPGRAIPHRERIQRLFGRHDISRVRAHVGGPATAATRSIGARAFASGERVVFGAQPDLRDSAHEAAHVVQQRAGVQLSGGLGRRGDRYERHADAVAQRVVQGRSAEPLLNNLSSSPARASSPAPVQLLTEREAYQDAQRVRTIKTYDPNAGQGKGGWVTPSGGRGSVKRRNKKGQGVDERMVTDLSFTSLRKEKEHAHALNRGALTLAQLTRLPEDTARRIDPHSETPRNILRGPLAESWSVAKDELAFPNATAGNKMVMKKLWEFRQWHHEDILQQTKRAVNARVGGRGLTGWSAAGSASLTSDIDVNLKGEATELAVAEFNRLFHADNWSYEAGVVYDVNVYAMDFLHAPVGVKPQGWQQGDPKRVGEEGARHGRPQGGISDQLLEQQDIERQEEWTLLKVRLYMSSVEWNAYKASIDPHNNDQAKWQRVENKYDAYRNTLTERMQQLANHRVGVPIVGTRTGMDNIGAVARLLALHSGGPPNTVSAKKEDFLIQASNRVYEEKLRAITRLRSRLNRDITWLNAMHARGARGIPFLERRINNELLQLRDLVSEAALYANEAYFTSGAVNHTVSGLQIGSGIQQTNADNMAAVNENLGDALKEMRRHGRNLGEAAYKSGKYIWRMADAALNMGRRTNRIRALYRAGYDIANTIKKSSANNKERLSADKIGAELAINQRRRAGVTALKTAVINAGQDVARWYNANIRQNRSTEPGLKVSKAKRRV